MTIEIIGPVVSPFVIKTLAAADQIKESKGAGDT